MELSRSILRNYRGALAIGAATTLCTARVYASSDKQDHFTDCKRNGALIGIYLTTASKKRLNEYLKQIGHPEYSGDMVVLNSHSGVSNFIDYSEFFTHRVAFRLKGLAFGDNFISGTGRVSVMEGEILNKDFTASLPLLRSAKDRAHDRYQEAILAPTLLNRRLNGDFSSPFLGKISGHSAGIHYSPVDESRELLLGGICCTEDCWDSINATCDVKKLEEKAKLLKTDIAAEHHEARVVVIPPENTSDVDDDVKCTVCRWLMAGPCSEEYTEWDAAMKAFVEDETDTEKRNAFFDTANLMSKCVRQHEYYDVYVAFL